MIKFYCDLCGKEVDAFSHRVSFTLLRGKLISDSEEPQEDLKGYAICGECADRIIAFCQKEAVESDE